MRVDRTLIVILILGLVGGCDGPPPPIPARLSMVGHSAEITALAYTRDGKRLVSRGADAIRVWDAGDLHELANLPSDGSDFGSVAIRPDGHALAAPLAGRGIVTWSLDDFKKQAVFGAIPAGTAPASSPEAFGLGLDYAPDSRTLAGPSSDPAAGSSIVLWDLASRQPVGLGPPGQPATHLLFTPDGGLLLSKGMEGTIQVWDVAARIERTAIAANSSYLAAVTISPDGKTVASAGADHYLKLYALDSGHEVAKFKGHLKAILGIAYHPDGRHIVTGDSGGSVFLWDIPTRRAIAQFPGHIGKVWAVAFRPDGQELASAGEDKQIQLHDVTRAIREAQR